MIWLRNNPSERNFNSVFILRLISNSFHSTVGLSRLEAEELNTTVESGVVLDARFSMNYAQESRYGDLLLDIFRDEPHLGAGSIVVFVVTERVGRLDNVARSSAIRHFTKGAEILVTAVEIVGRYLFVSGGRDVLDVSILRLGVRVECFETSSALVRIHG